MKRYETDKDVVPFGFLRDTVTGRLYENIEITRIACHIERLQSEGASMAEILDRLRGTRASNGQPWTEASVRELMSAHDDMKRQIRAFENPRKLFAEFSEITTRLARLERVIDLSAA